MKKNNNFLSNVKSIFFAIFIALIIRSFFAEPFNIPSGSMKPNLLVGDFIFVSKWSYGYSKHSLPFSLDIIPNSVDSFPDRIFNTMPRRGDVVVFKTPQDNKTDYIKRLIGLPGDKIQIIDGQIKINNKMILRKKNEDFIDVNNKGEKKRVRKYIEYFFDKDVEVLDLMDNGIVDNTNTYTVPKGYFFVMGDNRDNSQDSRFNVVGFVPLQNLVGKAQFVFFSLENSRFYQIWKWPKSIRYDRLFKSIK
jgi:signal peptidase I